VQVQLKCAAQHVELRSTQQLVLQDEVYNCVEKEKGFPMKLSTIKR
jgi:hypothetical protein